MINYFVLTILKLNSFTDFNIATYNYIIKIPFFLLNVYLKSFEICKLKNISLLIKNEKDIRPSL